jgi:heat-inducible transcriptional repressor
MFKPAIPGHLTETEPELSERQRRVFAALVAVHNRTARPVSSETLARQGTLPLSAASVRAALASLEELGLLERPHPAAARVPSAHGYEFFVRVLLEPEPLSPDLEAELDRRLQGSARDVEHLFAEASRLIASLTHQLGLAHSATLDRELLAGLDLEPIDDARALMILRLGAAAVRTLVLELENPLSRGELADVCAVLRERLIGRTLSEVRERLAWDPELVRGSAVRCVARAATERWSAPAGRTPFPDRLAAGPAATPMLFSAGMSHMAEQPEFMDASRLGIILRVVESGNPLERLMSDMFEGQAAVRVGLDRDQPLSTCSLVSYALPGPLRGAVGVLGPRRMDYARVLAVVDAVGNRVAELLNG